MCKGSVLKAVLLALLLLSGAGGAARAQGEVADRKLAEILERAGEAVVRYHAELSSIAYTETLTQQDLRKDMTPERSKVNVYDNVIARETLSEDEFYPRDIRRLRTADGRPNDKLAKQVEAVRGVSVASLHLLTPRYREFYRFTLEGEGLVDGRRAYRIRVERPGKSEPGDALRALLASMHFHPFAPSFVTVWVDAENYDTLRVESRLVAPFEFPRAPGAFGLTRRVKYERHDYAVRFRRVRFKDPEQMLLVPVEVERLSVMEGVREPRRRTTIRYTDYRRYRSDVKVVEEEAP